jgi:hypothetical protein
MQRDSVVMHPQFDAKIDPLKSKAKFTKALRSAILSIVPYRGVLGVTFPDVASPSDAGKSLRYTIDRASLPRGLMPYFRSLDEPEADERLAIALARLFKEGLAYDGDLVVRLYEAEDRDPIAVDVGPRTVYVEFGGVGSTGYGLGELGGITTADGSQYMTGLAAALGGMFGYYNAVKPGGPNDIKSQPGHSGKNPVDVAAGNISYGITCPYGARFCQFAAGAAQTAEGQPNLQGSLASGFDSPVDNENIQVGQKMRAAGCHE